MKHSASKGELSTEYSKVLVQTARNLNKTNNAIEHSKSLARESLHHLNSPDKSVVASTARRIQNSISNDVADETRLNFNKYFMDEYYASNGYFSFSVTREQLRAKDGIYDKLQTFVDERLLEVATQISVKQKAEDTKENNIDKLANLKDNIGRFYTLFIYIRGPN